MLADADRGQCEGSRDWELNALSPRGASCLHWKCISSGPRNAGKKPLIRLWQRYGIERCVQPLCGKAWPNSYDLRRSISERTRRHARNSVLSVRNGSKADTNWVVGDGDKCRRTTREPNPAGASGRALPLRPWWLELRSHPGEWRGSIRRRLYKALRQPPSPSRSATPTTRVRPG